MEHVLPEIEKFLLRDGRGRRAAFSTKHSKLKPIVICVRRLLRSVYNYFTIGIGYGRGKYYGHVIARHSSPLFRKLGDSDFELQANKVANLRVAISKLNGLIIPPGKIFSFWHAIGSIRRKKGYIDGMLLSDGRVTRGLGGGLCQLSNFLYWIFLHSDVEVIERHHHSRDVFPDSGRTLPFGSGATVFDNYLDLKIKNVSKQNLQIKVWLTGNALKGQILSDKPASKKYHVFEKKHFFIKKEGKYYRFNEIFRRTRSQGREQKIMTNFAPVMYGVNYNYIADHGYNLLDFDT